MSDQRSIQDSPWFWISKTAADRALDHGGSNLLLVYSTLCRLESNAPEESKSCFFASANQIARYCGLSTRTIQQLIPQLDRAGLATIISGRGGGEQGAHVANRYALLPIEAPYATDAHTPCAVTTYALTQIPQGIFADNKEPKELKEQESVVGEKRKRSKLSSPDLLTPSSIPTELDTPAFRTAWGEWMQHRKEKGAPLTPSAASKQLKKVAAWGEVRAVAAIDHSIFKNWQGIFEEQGHVPPPEQIVTSTPKPAAPEGWQDALLDLYPDATVMPWDELTQFHQDVADQVMNVIAERKQDGTAIAQNTL